MSLVECKTGAEVIENYKAVRRRTSNWRKPEVVPAAIPVSEVIEAAPSLNAKPILEPFIPPVPMRPYCTPAEPVFPARPTVSAIMQAVSLKFHVGTLDMQSQRRTRNIVVPRQAVMYLARRLTLRSLPEIGKILGGRDHSTVINGVRKIEKRRAADPDLDQKLNEIEAEVTGVPFVGQPSV